MPTILHLDYETRSDLDLRKVGLHVYAKGKNTDIWCASYAFNDDPVKLWTPETPCPPEIQDHIASGEEVWAHNAPFEIEITNQVGPKYKWPRISPEQAICTMAMSYAMGLPGSLEGCAAALGISERKDLEGSRLMIQMSKPREIKPDGTIVWWNEPEKLQRLYNYCVQDTIVERMAAHRMLRLSPYERRVWVLDQAINERGITVDVPAIFNALILVESEKDRLNKSMQTMTNNAVATCTAVQQIKDFLEFYGVSSDSLDKPHVLEHLTDSNLHPLARKVLELRQEAGKAAVSKFEPMLTGAGSDNRVRGCFQYSGANTRRWAGRRIQLHNLKRPQVKFEIVEAIIKDIARGATASELDMIYGPPLSILGDCTRSFLKAAPRHELGVCDYSAIEARVVAWLAGQDDVLAIFRANRDIYKAEASDIFGVPEDKVDDLMRQVGKVAVLALGFGGGVGAFQTMAAGYNVKMAPAFEALWARADEYKRNLAEENFKTNGKKYEISREEFIASDLTKMFWREANPKIVEYWKNVENVVRLAVRNPGAIYAAGPEQYPQRQVQFRVKGSFLWARLPSGGVICYPYPEIRPTKTPWGEKKELLTYMSEDSQSRKWERCSTYGGSLVENFTQSFSRDILADSMLRLDEAGFQIVLHVHDEGVCEWPKNLESDKNIKTMENIMAQVPSWAKDLPIQVKGFRTDRYRK